MAFASFVADAAIAVVQAAADEIGGPLAPALRRNAPSLVYTVRQLAVDMDAAIGVLTDIDKLEDLAFNALDDYPAVVGTTLNRNQERNNQAAIINFVRGLATVRFAGRVGIEEYRDREQARANRDSSTEALDQREADANTRVFRSLRGLRAAVVEHVREELLRLPPVIVATPASVQPSLAIAYGIFMKTSAAPPTSLGVTLAASGLSSRRTLFLCRGSSLSEHQSHLAIACRFRRHLVEPLWPAAEHDRGNLDVARGRARRHRHRAEQRPFKICGVPLLFFVGHRSGLPVLGL